MRLTQSFRVQFDDTDADNPTFEVRTSCCNTPVELNENDNGQLSGSSHDIDVVYDPADRTLVVTTDSKRLTNVSIGRLPETDNYVVTLEMISLLDMLTVVASSLDGPFAGSLLDDATLGYDPYPGSGSRRRRTFLGIRI